MKASSTPAPSASAAIPDSDSDSDPLVGIECDYARRKIARMWGIEASDSDGDEDNEDEWYGSGRRRRLTAPDYIRCAYDGGDSDDY